MPAYNFKKQFADAVENGTKRNTIRPKRKRPTVPGDILFHYTGMRTRKARKLLEAECLKVDPIEIGVDYIILDGRELEISEQSDLATKDGFSSLFEFRSFFIKVYGMDQDNPMKDFVVIYW